jgi:hypothetical protein
MKMNQFDCCSRTSNIRLYIKKKTLRLFSSCCSEEKNDRLFYNVNEGIFRRFVVNATKVCVELPSIVFVLCESF